MKPLDTVLLRHDQIKELREDKAEIERVLNDPFLRQKVKVGEARRQLGNIDRMINDQAAEPLTSDESNKLHKMEKDLRAKITTNMPTQEIMRKNPPGAVNWHRTWEKAMKPFIKRWKNIRRQLDPTSEDPDISNLERYRPPGAVGTLRTDAQITGHMTYGGVPDDKWDAVFEGKPDSALEQAKRVARKERKPMSEQAKQAACDRLAHAREMRRVKRMAVQHGEPDVAVEVSVESQPIETVNV